MITVSACKRLRFDCQGSSSSGDSQLSASSMESDPWRNRAFWLLSHRRLAELCSVDAAIGLDLVQLGGVSAVQPRELDFELKFYAAYAALLGQIHQSGHSSDGQGALP